MTRSHYGYKSRQDKSYFQDGLSLNKIYMAYSQQTGIKVTYGYFKKCVRDVTSTVISE